MLLSLLSMSDQLTITFPPGSKTDIQRNVTLSVIGWDGIPESHLPAVSPWCRVSKQYSVENGDSLERLVTNHTKEYVTDVAEPTSHRMPTLYQNVIADNFQKGCSGHNLTKIPGMGN